mmetsp:Transcript_22671/g.51946  ORF Transcript_22671/g.51946 Transcript_22671/m.51946 type:complete len:85 (+) Transcript_22671:457-711(+)
MIILAALMMQVMSAFRREMFGRLSLTKAIYQFIQVELHRIHHTLVDQQYVYLGGYATKKRVSAHLPLAKICVKVMAIPKVNVTH